MPYARIIHLINVVFTHQAEETDKENSRPQVAAATTSTEQNGHNWSSFRWKPPTRKQRRKLKYTRALKLDKIRFRLSTLRQQSQVCSTG